MPIKTNRTLKTTEEYKLPSEYNKITFQYNNNYINLLNDIHFFLAPKNIIKIVEIKGSVNYFSSLIKWILVDQTVCYKVQWFSVFTKNNTFFLKKKQ